MVGDKTDDLIRSLSESKNEIYNKDFLLTWKNSHNTISKIMLAAEALQELYKRGVSAKAFQSGLGYCIFRDNSTRTRYSFRSGCNLLGLMTEELNEETSQIAHGETVRETATMISFLTEVIGIRDDIFLGEGHKYMWDVSRSVQQSYDEGVLNQRPAVINLQCDLDHPTQSLSDLRHLVSHFGGIDKLKGKKLAMTWAYSPSYGKPLSVPQGIIALMSRFGMNVVLAHPKGYNLVDETLNVARQFSDETDGSFSVADSMEDAFDGADIVYPKSWASMSIMKERTKILREGKADELKALSKAALAENANFKNWECDEKLMGATNGGKALYMHCLPADVTGVSCKEGEVSEKVFERYRLDTYKEASHKPFVIAAMILLTRFKDPASVLKGLLADSTLRSK